MFRHNKAYYLAVTIIMLGMVIFFIAVFGTWDEFPRPNNPPEIAPQEGSFAPDFNLVSINGEMVQLSDFQGQTVLINFWATWCGPCRIEMPVIEKKFQAYYPAMVVLAINFDEPREIVKTFVDEMGLTFDVLLDPGGEIQQKYLIRGYPTTFFVDQAGVIQIQHIGVMTEHQIDGYLEDIGVLP